MNDNKRQLKIKDKMWNKGFGQNSVLNPFNQL